MYLLSNKYWVWCQDRNQSFSQKTELAMAFLFCCSSKQIYQLKNQPLSCTKLVLSVLKLCVLRLKVLITVLVFGTNISK